MPPRITPDNKAGRRPIILLISKSLAVGLEWVALMAGYDELLA